MSTCPSWKRRLTKQCDECVPCSRCSRLGVKCSLQTLIRAPPDHKVVVMEQNRPGLLQRWKSTSELMMGLTLDKSMPDLWSKQVLEMASRHDFLYHAVLSLSALHADLLQPSDKTSLLAMEHRAISLGLFRQELGRLTKDNVNALFACQCIAVAYSLGSQSHEVSLLAWKNMLTILRATKVIVVDGGQPLLTGPFGGMIQLQPATDVEVSEDMRRTLSSLSSRLGSSISTTAYYEALEGAISLLRYALSLLPKPEFDQVAINTFMLMVDQEFLNLVFLGEPLALAILGNYAVCLHVVGQRNILVRGWGREVLDEVQSRLPEEWQGEIKWAKREVGLARM